LISESSVWVSTDADSFCKGATNNYYWFWLLGATIEPKILLRWRKLPTIWRFDGLLSLCCC